MKKMRVDELVSVWKMILLLTDESLIKTGLYISVSVVKCRFGLHVTTALHTNHFIEIYSSAFVNTWFATL